MIDPKKRLIFPKFSQKTSYNLSISLVQNILVLDKSGNGLSPVFDVDYKNKMEMILNPAIQFFIDAQELLLLERKYNLSISFVQNILALDKSGKAVSCVQVDYKNKKEVFLNPSIQFFIDAQELLLLKRKNNLSISLVQNILMLDKSGKPVFCVQVDYKSKKEVFLNPSIQFFIDAQEFLLLERKGIFLRKCLELLQFTQWTLFGTPCIFSTEAVQGPGEPGNVSELRVAPKRQRKVREFRKKKQCKSWKSPGIFGKH